MAAYSFTQPCCGACFLDFAPGRRPTRVLGAESERCCHCGMHTDEGIYIRVDPATVPYPTRTKD